GERLLGMKKLPLLGREAAEKSRHDPLNRRRYPQGSKVALRPLPPRRRAHQRPPLVGWELVSVLLGLLFLGEESVELLLRHRGQLHGALHRFLEPLLGRPNRRLT